MTLNPPWIPFCLCGSVLISVTNIIMSVDKLGSVFLVQLIIYTVYFEGPLIGPEGCPQNRREDYGGCFDWYFTLWGYTLAIDKKPTQKTKLWMYCSVMDVCLYISAELEPFNFKKCGNTGRYSLFSQNL